MRRNLRLWIVLAAIMVRLFDATTAYSQSDDEKTRSAATLENGKLEAAAYVVRTAEADQKPITLHAESLLKWQNTVNKSVHGNIFIWTRNGRPEVVASIFQFYSPKQAFAAEFQSLSLGPVIVEKKGKVVWTPKEAGIVLKPFENEIEPSDSKPQRLRQMRQLAQNFTVELTEYDGEPYRLRLLPQPLYRYESTDPQVLDGALFSYTYTTDPDLLVVVEARKSNDRFQWMFGLARMNVGDVKVLYNNRDVFHAERLETYSHPNGAYTIFQGLPLPALDDNSK